MRQFRYDTSGRWFKGNTHIHSTFSDGGKTPDELAEMYAAAGYDFLCRTDHGVASDVAAEDGSPPLLWIDGIEINGADGSGGDYHVICLGKFVELPAEAGIVEQMRAAREQDGIIILAHPRWCGNSQADALRHGFDGLEIYNHVCQWLNGKGDGFVHWDMMLANDPGTLGLAVDDAHTRPEHPGWNGGWIVVNAAQCTRDAILTAIRAGNFYASTGPEFASIEMSVSVETNDEGEEIERVSVTVRTSPVAFIRLVGPGSRGNRVGSFEGETVTEATFEVPAKWPLARVEIEDASGKRAWTNPLFAAE
ncbi:MAG: CehA/McbA family metallohydrolase [Planctomycetota bacterium]